MMETMNMQRKKLIEVALPLDAINVASAREKSIRHGHPSTLHLWWARRPLAAARAVLFAQMVDDPASVPEEFPTPEAQETERRRLFTLMEQLVLWENTTNEKVLKLAREEIQKSWQRTCKDHQCHPQAAELFNPDRLPPVHDPFAGGGTIPLEAQRLGLKAFASDLNPVAVLINKAMIEIPPKFAGQPPINPEARERIGIDTDWKGAQGLAEDVRYYGQWVRDEAEKRIGHLYPKIQVTAEMAAERPDLQPYVGRSLTVIAWLWARTVKSPNPAFRNIDVPLASTFMLSTKAGQQAWIEPIVEGNTYRFIVRTGRHAPAEAKDGTKLARGANFRCILSDVPISDSYIKSESMAGCMGSRLMAIVAEGDRGRIYLSPTPEHEQIARQAQPEWKPDQEMNRETTNLVSGRGYGFFTWADLFTPRQLVALTTFSDLVGEAMERVRCDCADLPDNHQPLREGGVGVTAYAEAVGVYLGLGIGRSATYWSAFTPWGGSFIVQTFGRQAIPMVWDHAEGNPFSSSTGNWLGALDWIKLVIENTLPASKLGYIFQADAGILDELSAGASGDQEIAGGGLVHPMLRIFSTDPPYYDNIGYADLSDFFYVWLRRALRTVYPDLFATLAVPKAEELIAAPHRHGSKQEAERFFLDGMTQAMSQIQRLAHPAFPVTIYYAFKQAETKGNGETVSTGWETFLDAVIRAGFALTGTWPVRTEMGARQNAMETNALASSIVLVCRPRPADAPAATRGEFLSALKQELKEAVRLLQGISPDAESSTVHSIAPVDLAQAAIGPGMAIFTRYSRVTDMQDRRLSVRDALALINQVLDEVLAEQEGDYDPDTRWAIAWFEQHGFNDGDYGDAETLAVAKNTSVGGLQESGILRASRGIVRLLKPEELEPDWNPAQDTRLSDWEVLHHLIRILNRGGEEATAGLIARLGSRAETARELAYRLYMICDRKKRASEALHYNALAQSWHEMALLAQRQPETQTNLFSEEQ
jgi:putative DNA methylase